MSDNPMTHRATTRGLICRKGIWHIEGEASFAFWNAVDPSVGRTHAFDGQPRMATQGLRGAGQRSAMLPAKLSALSPATLRLLPRCGPARTSMSGRSPPCGSPCSAQKAGDLPSWQIPFDIYVSPCFARSRKQMERFTVVRNTYDKRLCCTLYRGIP